MSAVDGAERVGDVDIHIGGELLCELLVVLLLLGMVAEVFEKDYIAVVHGGDLLFRVLADDVVREYDVDLGQKLLQPLRHGSKAHLGHELALGAAKVGAEDDLCAAVDEILDGGQRALDTALIRDVELLIEGHVEVDAYEHAAAGDVDVFYGQLVHIKPPI